MTSTTTRPITRADLSDDLRPTEGWTTWSRELFWRLWTELDPVNDADYPRSAKSRRRRALRGARVGFLHLAGRDSLSCEQIASHLSVSPRLVEQARQDLRAVVERPTQVRPLPIPREDVP